MWRTKAQIREVRDKIVEDGDDGEKEQETPEELKTRYGRRGRLGRKVEKRDQQMSTHGICRIISMQRRKHKAIRARIRTAERVSPVFCVLTERGLCNMYHVCIFWRTAIGI